MNIEKEYKQLKESAKLAADASFKLSEQVYNLKAENERLKEEIEIRDNLSEKFRKEALSWANIANEYQKDCKKFEKLLQEIKEIAENAKRDICNNCGWRNTESCDPEDYTCGEFIKILQKITKAEEE